MTGKLPQISIIIPIYNTEKYIPACLNSCIHQTLRDIEIVCVNDGSADDSERIVLDFQKKDPRIKFISQPNRGLPAARNTGINNSIGSILMFLDSDDMLSENACERVWLEKKETSANIIIFGSQHFPEYPQPDPWVINTMQVQTEKFYKFHPDILFCKQGSIPFVWRQAYSRDFLDNHTLRFDEEAKFGEDLVFQMEAFPWGNTFSFISDTLYNYRWTRPGSLMAEAERDMTDKIEKHMDNLDRICTYWEKLNWFNQYGVNFVEWMLRFTVPDILNHDAFNEKLHFAHLNQIIKRYDLLPWLKKIDSYHYNLYETFQELMEK